MKLDRGKEEERAKKGGENRTPMDNGIVEDGRVLVKVGSFRLEENGEGSERDTEVYDCKEHPKTCNVRTLSNVFTNTRPDGRAAC